MQAIQTLAEGNSSAPKKSLKALVSTWWNKTPRWARVLSKVFFWGAILVAVFAVAAVALAYVLGLVFFFGHILYQFWYVGGAGYYEMGWDKFHYFPQGDWHPKDAVSIQVLGWAATSIVGVVVVTILWIMIARHNEERKYRARLKEDRRNLDLRAREDAGRRAGFEASRTQIYVALIHAYRPQTILLPEVPEGAARYFFIHVRVNHRFVHPTDDTFIHYIDWTGGDLPCFMGAPAYRVVQVPKDQPDRLTFMGREYRLKLQSEKSLEVEFVTL